LASYNKILQFTKDLIDGVHDIDGHVFKVVLSNTAVVNTNATLSAISEIANGNGYTTGGTTTTVTTGTSSGTAKATATDVVFTASGGSMAAARYFVLYNDTPSSPADPTIAWWDYASSVTLLVGETFTWDADATNGIFTVA
jgi:hypothetical protein